MTKVVTTSRAWPVGCVALAEEREMKSARADLMSRALSRHCSILGSHSHHLNETDQGIPGSSCRLEQFGSLLK